jgi:hypothetical protein
MIVRVGIALAQGALLWWLFDAAESGTWPAEQRGWLVALIAAGVLVPLAHYVLADLVPPARQLPVLAALAALSLGLGWHHGAWAGGEPDDPALSFALPMAVLVFHAMPFAQSWLTRGLARPRYQDLFHFAWRNALMGALGALFTGVFWILLWLWGELFHMIGIDAFRDLFESSPFAVPATTVALGVGVQLAGSVERLQGALRQQLLALLKWLAPVATLILVMFTVALLAKAPELLLEQRRVISASWLLWLVALTVALLNAAYQDGGEAAPYPRWLGAGIRAATVLLLPIALLAIYAIGVRIEAYGVTVPRAWGLLVAVIALGYAAGYAWAAWRRGAWMAGIGPVNVGVALFTIAMLTLMLTPVLSPERIAAGSQHRRALTGAANADDDAFRYLRFNSGRYGRRRLADLAAIEGHPRADDIRARARRELLRKRRWEPPPAEALAAGGFEAFPASASVDPGLLQLLGKSTEIRTRGACTPEFRCPLLFADLDRDGAPEAIVFTGFGSVAARRGEKGWQLLDSRWVAGSPDGANPERLQRALQRGEYRIVELPLQAIEIDGRYHVFTDPPDCVSPNRAALSGCR